MGVAELKRKREMRAGRRANAINNKIKKGDTGSPCWYTIEVHTEHGKFDNIIIEAVQRAAIRLKANIGFLAKTEIIMFYDDENSAWISIPELLPEDGEARDE
jgi:hypothetical protein